MWRWVLSAALVGAWLPSAAFADVYSYEQDNGTLAFTDDAEHVPERYRRAMKQAPDRALEDYPRLTIRSVPAQRKPATDPAAAAQEMHFPMLNPVGPLAGSAPVYLQAGPGLLIPATLGNPDEPLRVTREFRWVDGRYTPLVVVRRGDVVVLETVEVAPQY